MSSRNEKRLPVTAYPVLLGAAAFLIVAAGVARADVSISSKPTQNMSCSDGVCTPTAKKAVLNVGDLANMLASGDVTVNTGGSLAKDIEISAVLSWASASRLTLDAFRSITVKKPVSVTGTGALTITTNDGGNNGEFTIEGKASIQFWDLNSSLIIDGHSYALVGDIKTLADDIVANPSGFYALAKPYDASVDGTYSKSAITTEFLGVFEGLGNTIANFKMRYTVRDTSDFGFFEHVGILGIVRDFGLANADIAGSGSLAGVATLVSFNEGLVDSCWATGSLSQSGSFPTLGGLVSANGGTISRSFADVQVSGADVHYLGGLAGANGGTIIKSFSKGSIKSSHSSDSAGGGITGWNDGQGPGQIADSFSVTKVHDGRQNFGCCYGGLVGKNGSGATITNTYAAGRITENDASDTYLGGLVGEDDAAPGSLAHTYWDLDKGVSDPSQGAGNIKNDPGIKGLTTQELQSGLPKGFDPKIWAQDPSTNQGFPYLRGLPSKK